MNNKLDCKNKKTKQKQLYQNPSKIPKNNKNKLTTSQNNQLRLDNNMMNFQLRSKKNNYYMMKKLYKNNF